MKKLILMTTFFWVAMLGNWAWGQSVDADQLPKYVVIGAEDTKLIGGIGIYIAKKKSDDRGELSNLEYYLHTVKKVRTVTDLLNEMDAIGFEYIDTFQSGAKSVGADGNYTYGDAEKTRYSIVFKKYRDG